MSRLLVVGNPENRRIKMLRAAGRDTGWRVQTASYLDLLTGKCQLAELADGAEDRTDLAEESAHG